MSSRKAVRPSRPVFYIIALFTVGMVCGAGFAFLEDVTDLGWISSGLGLVAVSVLAAILLVATLWLGARWMKSLDEAAQEAHKWSWYWGGSVGMAVGMVLILVGSLPQTAGFNIESWYLGRTDPVAYMATGAFGIVGLMIAGYIVAWALWWLQRR